jgi:CheY-like chemotaxis protein
LTKQLLSLSRKTPAAPKPLQLNDLIRRMEKLLHRLLDEQLSLEIVLDPELDEVLADATQLERLLVQLVGEARSTSAKGGRLLIETRNADVDAPPGTDRQVMLRISDSGGSLSSEVAALSPFVDAGTTWLENEPGSGTRFVVCFPSLNSRVPPPPLEPRKMKAEIVLVVQDNPHLRKTLKTYFAREGYRVLDADSSIEALRILEQTAHVDLLLTDYSLTDGTGPELARAMREQLPELKVLIASGHPEQRATVQEDDRTAIIGKPFDLREFGQLIERLLRDEPSA